MPGLWLLVEGSWALWWLLLEQTPPVQREHRLLLSQLEPEREHLRHLQAGTTRRGKQVDITFLFH